MQETVKKVLTGDFNRKNALTALESRVSLLYNNV